MAQVRLEPFWPYSQYSLGFSAGNTTMYGDLQNSVSEPIYRVTFERNFNSYTGVGLEYQNGALASQENRNHWTNGLSSYDQLNTLALYGRVSLGQFFKYPKNYLMKNLFGLYFGTGIGCVYDDVSNITLKFRNRDPSTIQDYNEKYIRTTVWSAYIPYNIGFNLHLTKRVMFNVNYQFCYFFSDYIDGYNFTNPPANNYYNDMCSMLTFGLIFNLGPVYDTWYDENGIKEKVRHLSD
jgi:hypothetical protein